MDFRRLIRENIRRVLFEGELKPGTTFKLPTSGNKGCVILAKMYGKSPYDFIYRQNNNDFIYKPAKRKNSSGEKQFKGKPEGMSDADYLDIVRQQNKKFAEQESEIQGEEWRPVQNPGLYFGGDVDYSKSYEVSNMGRIRVIDFNDPMRSRISGGYDAPQRKARQFTMYGANERGERRKTTPHLANMVAAAFLDPPEGELSSYYVEHLDGDYNNNRLDNLRYVKRSGRKAAVGESRLNRIIRESVKRSLNEIYNEFFEEDPENYPLMQSSFDDPSNEVVVYQLNHDNETAQKKRFLSWYDLRHFGFEFDPADYEIVFKGILPAESPEDVYKLLQGRKPKGYRGYSLSVGDVIELKGEIWFCDDYGFKNITKIWG